MSLLDDYAVPCVLMEEADRVPDGAGGHISAWAEGQPFTAVQWLDASAEARRAEQEGIKSVYSAFVAKDFPLRHGDVFKNTGTGLTYRVTSEPDERKAPPPSTFGLKFFTAERWELPA